MAALPLPATVGSHLSSQLRKSPKSRSGFSSTELPKETADDPMKGTPHHRARPRGQRRHGSRIQRRQGRGLNPEPRSGWQRSHSRSIWDNFCDPQLFHQAQSAGSSRFWLKFRGLIEAASGCFLGAWGFRSLVFRVYVGLCADFGGFEAAGGGGVSLAFYSSLGGIFPSLRVFV